MKMQSLKKMCFWLTLAALTSIQAVYAGNSSGCCHQPSHQSSHHSCHKPSHQSSHQSCHQPSHHSCCQSGHHSHHFQFREIRLAKISLQRYLSDLNVAILAESLATPETASIVNAYNEDIVIATAALQSALAALGAVNQAEGIAFQFNSYAIIAEQIPSGTSTIAELFEASLALADALIALSPSLDPAIISEFVTNLNTAVVGIITNYGQLNYPAAVEENNLAHVIGNDLIRYITRIFVAH